MKTLGSWDACHAYTTGARNVFTHYGSMRCEVRPEDGVEQELERGVSLSPVLCPESEQYHVARAEWSIDDRRRVAEMVFAQRPAAQEQRGVWVGRHRGRRLEAGSFVESAAAAANPEGLTVGKKC